MSSKFLENYPLFKECIEALNSNFLQANESREMSLVFKKMFPITDWGKIDWEKIKNKIEIGYDPEDIIPALERILGKKFDKNVYLEWSDAGIPIIKTTIEKIVEHFDDVTCVAFEKFIFNPILGYIIEIRSNDLITLGVINDAF